MKKKEPEVEYAKMYQYEGEEWIDLECSSEYEQFGPIVRVSANFPKLADDLRWYINESYRARS